MANITNTHKMNVQPPQFDLEALQKERAALLAQLSVENYEKRNRDIANATKDMLAMDYRCAQKFRENYLRDGEFDKYNSKCVHFIEQYRMPCATYIGGVTLGKGAVLKCDKVNVEGERYYDLLVTIDHTRYYNQ